MAMCFCVDENFEVGFVLNLGMRYFGTIEDGIV